MPQQWNHWQVKWVTLITFLQSNDLPGPRTRVDISLGCSIHLDIAAEEAHPSMETAHPDGSGPSQQVVVLSKTPKTDQKWLEQSSRAQVFDPSSRQVPIWLSICWINRNKSDSQWLHPVTCRTLICHQQSGVRHHSLRQVFPHNQLITHVEGRSFILLFVRHLSECLNFVVVGGEDVNRKWLY